MCIIFSFWQKKQIWHHKTTRMEISILNTCSLSTYMQNSVCSIICIFNETMTVIVIVLTDVPNVIIHSKRFQNVFEVEIVFNSAVSFH